LAPQGNLSIHSSANAKLKNIRTCRIFVANPTRLNFRAVAFLMTLPFFLVAFGLARSALKRAKSEGGKSLTSVFRPKKSAIHLPYRT